MITTATTATPASQDEPSGTAPGELMRLTAACLTAAGIMVRQDGEQVVLNPARRPRSKKRARETGAAWWTLTVADDARVRLRVRPWARETSDPHWLGGIAAALLTGSAIAGSREGGGPDSDGPGITAAAGLHLRHRGFWVQLNSYADDETLELTADVSATLPEPDGGSGTGGTGTGGTGGTVYISDDGSIFFDRSYWHDHARTEWEPDYRSWLPDPSAAARDIAGTVVAAIAVAQARYCPARQSRR